MESNGILRPTDWQSFLLKVSKIDEVEFRVGILEIWLQCKANCWDHNILHVLYSHEHIGKKVQKYYYFCFLLTQLDTKNASFQYKVKYSIKFSTSRTQRIRNREDKIKCITYICWRGDPLVKYKNNERKVQHCVKDHCEARPKY